LKEKLEFIHPDKLPDEMPRNPKCGKAQNGYTFRPPHRDVSLRKLVDQYCAEQQSMDFFDFVEQELHTELIKSI